eukprot:TRINITY_DN52524_c0_g1_i1.p1 TRINITY_DN52524_c0_g1~~TRINITY_DN52524_c0_g1_i1.p1  ORF type:complete len:220 (-),score=16.87 TRINITY_DN52524_c0_g1_i1:109-768(-)
MTKSLYQIHWGEDGKGLRLRQSTDESLNQQKARILAFIAVFVNIVVFLGGAGLSIYVGTNLRTVYESEFRNTTCILQRQTGPKTDSHCSKGSCQAGTCSCVCDYDMISPMSLEVFQTTAASDKTACSAFMPCQAGPSCVGEIRSCYAKVRGQKVTGLTFKSQEEEVGSYIVPFLGSLFAMVSGCCFICLAVLFLRRSAPAAADHGSESGTESGSGTESE